MIHYFPTPYPDELWYSVLCRYHVRSGNLYPQTTITELFEKKTHAAMGAMFPNNCIHDIIKQLPKGMFDIEDIILNHTLFKFFTRIHPLNKKQQMLDDIAEGKAPVLTHIWKATSREKAHIKYCPLCVKEDKEVYGESYWHLEHQITLMRTCRKHGCHLKTYTCRNKSELNDCFILPDQCEQGEADMHLEPWEVEVADIASDYQNLPLDVGPTEGHNNLYMGLVNEGYGKILQRMNQSLDMKQIREDLFKYFGKELTERCFGKETESSKAYIMSRIQSWRLVSPERYILLAALIHQSTEVTFGKVPLESKMLVQLLKLKEDGVFHSRNYIAKEIGVAPHSLSGFARMLKVEPFWDCDKTQEECRTEMIKTYVTSDEKKRIDDLVLELGFSNRSAFVHQCIMEKIKETKC